MTKSIIACPKCGFKAEEEMPTDACQFFYECKSCKSLLKPLVGDCCVYRSFCQNFNKSPSLYLAFHLSGKRNTASAPFDMARLVTVIVPPCRVIIFFANLRPRPLPLLPVSG